MPDLKTCPFCGKKKVYIGVHDDEGNYHGRLGCDYESNPWSGLTYGLQHDGWGDCILCTDGPNCTMGGLLFDTAEDAVDRWNRRNGAETANRVEKRAVKIAARIMQAAGLCRYDDVSKCRRVYADESTCDDCIEKWLLGKARKELKK